MGKYLTNMEAYKKLGSTYSGDKGNWFATKEDVISGGGDSDILSKYRVGEFIPEEDIVKAQPPVYELALYKPSGTYTWDTPMKRNFIFYFEKEWDVTIDFTVISIEDKSDYVSILQVIGDEFNNTRQYIHVQAGTMGWDTRKTPQILITLCKNNGGAFNIHMNDDFVMNTRYIITLNYSNGRIHGVISNPSTGTNQIIDEGVDLFNTTLSKAGPIWGYVAGDHTFPYYKGKGTVTYHSDVRVMGYKYKVW